MFPELDDPWDKLKSRPVLQQPYGKKGNALNFRVEGWASVKFWSHGDDAYLGLRTHLIRSGDKHLTKISLHKDGTNLYKYQGQGRRIRFPDPCEFDGNWNIALRMVYPFFPVVPPVVVRLGYDEDQVILPRPHLGHEMNVTVFVSREALCGPPPANFQIAVGPFDRRCGGKTWVLFSETLMSKERFQLTKELIISYIERQLVELPALPEIPTILKFLPKEESVVPTVVVPPVDWSILNYTREECWSDMLKKRKEQLQAILPWPWLFD